MTSGSRAAAFAAVLAAVPGALLPSSAALAAQVDQGKAEFYAERLAEDPVHVSDHLAGRYDREGTAEELRGTLARLDVPVHALVLPVAVSDPVDESLLAAVHDRLGEDGLYLLFPASGAGVSGTAHGVDVPLEAALDATRFSGDLDYDAPVAEVAAHFVDAALAEDPEASAESAREEIGRNGEESEEGEEGPDAGFLTEFLGGDLDPARPVGRENIGFVTGTALGAAVTGALVVFVRRRTRARPAAPGRRPGGVRPRRRT
ncbi:hypothetical protein HDA32_004852 [Spinactinospora alkalitolerans]|uniref:TPM domain-containing protein n=1 Tax=Spinactinospora alkalitolerans TaxID=687207 RepID=A0A852U2R9_9ACTN|nr:hypothetical protein [Spinactinospora alkalitolerans]NYE49732.1 hypothetical protein [Spinactinospora alkalitolerans]